MAKPKIALYLGDLTPEQKTAQAHTINNLMANHVTEFPTPKPALTAYNTAASNVDARLATISIMEQNLETERSLLREDVAVPAAERDVALVEGDEPWPSPPGMRS